MQSAVVFKEGKYLIRNSGKEEFFQTLSIVNKDEKSRKELKNFGEKFRYGGCNMHAIHRDETQRNFKHSHFFKWHS